MTIEAITVAEGADSARGLGFVAHSVTVENFSNSWIWISSASKFVAPWRAQTIELLQPSDVAAISWRNPPLIPVSPPTNGQAFAYWSDADTATTQPVTLFTGSSQGSQVDTGQVFGNVGPTTHAGVSIPTGTMALGLQMQPFVNESCFVTVKGVQTGAVYFNNVTNGPNLFPTSTFDPVDTTVNVTFSGSGIGTSAFSLVAYPFVPVPAQSDGAGMLVDIGGASGIGVTNPLMVTVTSLGGGQKPGLQSAAVKTVIVNQPGLAAGASVNLIAAGGPGSITVFGWSLKVTGNAVNSFTSGQLGDNHGNYIHRLNTVTSTLASQLASPDTYFSPYGKQLFTAADPLVLLADAGNTTNLIVHGSIDYIQN